MRDKIDFLIFYEGLNREMESISLLKAELKQRGYKVVISHFMNCDYALTKKLNPKVVITPWLRFDENVYRYTCLFKNPPKIVNLQWEQVFSQYGLETGLEVIRDSALRAYHLCWGNATVERLVREGVRRENTRNVGNISLDFCKPVFQNYYLSKKVIAKKENLKSEKKWILYISSFSYDTYDDATVKVLDSRSSGSYKEMMDSSNLSREATLDWIESYLIKYSDKEYIYRPHPSEKNHPRLEMMKNKYLNFHVCTNYNIKQWIFVADTIQLWNSTSIAEVYLMNKKCSIIRPLPLNDIYQAEYYPGSVNITEFDEFLNNCVNGNSDLEFPISPETMMNYYSNGDDYSFMRTADALVDILKSDRVQNLNPKVELSKRLLYKRREFASELCSLAYKFKPFFALCRKSKSSILSNCALAAENKMKSLRIQNKIEKYYKTYFLQQIDK